MSKLKETFITIVNEGYTTTKQISDSSQKAMALAALAQAIAQSGLLTTGVAIETAPAQDAEPVAATGKDSLKPEASKGTKKKSKKAEKVEEVVEEVIEEAPVAVEEETVEEAPVEETPTETESELDEEWTEAMQELKAEELSMLEAYVEAWGDDCVYGDCLKAFMEDSTITMEDVWNHIRPTNIDGFIAYLASLAEEGEE